MVSIKVLFVLGCMIASTSCTLPFNAGEIVLGGLHPHKSSHGFLDGILSTVFDNIAHITNLKFGYFKTMKKPNTLVDVFGIVQNFCLSTGKLLDKVAPGIAVQFSGLIDVWYKILYCIHGLPVPFSDQITCQGLEQYKGTTDARNWKIIFNTCGVGKIQTRIGTVINKIKVNNSLRHIPISARISLRLILKLSLAFKVNFFLRVKQTVTKFIVRILTIVGSIMNSNQYGSGEQFLDKIIVHLNPILRKYDFQEITVYTSYMKNKVRKCRSDGAVWSSGNSEENNNANDDDTNEADIDDDSGDDNQTDAPQTDAPTQAPTKAPTQAPTDAPTEAPTQAPTKAPTQAPTNAPTDNKKKFLEGIVIKIFTQISETTNINFGGVIKTIQKPSNIGGVFRIIRIFGVSVGKLLDTVASGIGVQFTNLIDVWYRIVYCIHGLPVPNSNQITCQGLEQYKGTTDAKNWKIIFNTCGVGKIQTQIGKVINKIKVNNSLKHIPLSARISLRLIQKLSLAFKVSYFLKVKQVVTKFIVRIITIVGSIMNSNQYGAGEQFLDKITAVLNPILKQQNFQEITVYTSFMKTNVRKCRSDGAVWSSGNSEVNNNANDDDSNDTDIDDDSGDDNQTDAPQTDAPQTDAPQTDAPQTDAPQTDAPTQRPQTPTPGDGSREVHCTCQ